MRVHLPDTLAYFSAARPFLLSQGSIFGLWSGSASEDTNSHSDKRNLTPRIVMYAPIEAISLVRGFVRTIENQHVRQSPGNLDVENYLCRCGGPGHKMRVFATESPDEKESNHCNRHQLVRTHSGSLHRRRRDVMGLLIRRMRIRSPLRKCAASRALCALIVTLLLTPPMNLWYAKRSISSPPIVPSKLPTTGSTFANSACTRVTFALVESHRHDSAVSKETLMSTSIPLVGDSGASASIFFSKATISNTWHPGIPEGM
jgi:hypothetical protein